MMLVSGASACEKPLKDNLQLLMTRNRLEKNLITLRTCGLSTMTKVKAGLLPSYTLPFQFLLIL